MSRDDDTLRARLRALAEHEPLPQLNKLARAQAAERARRQLATQRRRTHIAFGLLAACLPLALLTLKLLRTPLPADAEHASLHVPPTAVREGPSTPLPVDTGACEAKADLHFATGNRGERILDLGSRALLVATPGAQIEAALTASCDLHTVLRSGSVAVHARRLRGAALMVSTPRGAVRVKGTVFQVDFDASTQMLHVGVEEGRVSVQTAAGPSRELAPGQALRVGKTLSDAPFSDQARTRLRQVLGLAAAPRTTPAAQRADVDAPTMTQHDPAPDVVRAWHQGSVDAPALAPEPGTSLTPEGRPMAKPKLIPPNAATEPRGRSGDAP